MTTLVQGNHTIQEFYQMVYQHLSLILNKLSCMNMGNESLQNMTQSYRDKALDTFVRGLKGDLSRLLSIREPVDLPQALHLCLKLQNVDFRAQYANNSQHNLLRKQALPPPIPPRRNNYQVYNPQQPFFPQLLHNPQMASPPFFQRYPKPSMQPFYRQNFAQQPQFPFRPRLNFPNRALPNPEPMDIDRSIQSRQINYANRHKMGQLPQKRPFSHQINNPNKMHRIHHTVPASDEVELPEHQEDYEITYEDDETDETCTDFVHSMEDPNVDEAETLDDNHFLD